MMQRIDDNVIISGFDIPRINKFIEDQATSVFVFFTRLVNVDISQITLKTDDREKTNIQIFDTQLIRIDDLDLLFDYSKMIYEDKPNSEQNAFRKSYGKVQENLFWDIDNDMKFIDIDELDSNILLKSYKHTLGKTITSYIDEILDLNGISDPKQEERYLMIFKPNTDSINQEMEKWDKQQHYEIVKMTQNFVKVQLLEQNDINSSGG